MENEATVTKIKNKLRVMPKNRVFIYADFSKTGSYDAIRSSIHRMIKEDEIVSLGNGLFKKKNYSELFQREVPADPYQMAMAYARKNKWQVFPSKNLALNILGLSTQVPNVLTFRSDSASREIRFNGTLVIFEKATNKYFFEHFKTNLVVEAIRYIGEEAITVDDLVKIRSALTDKEFRNLLKDRPKMTLWIQKEIQKMVKLDE